MGPTRRDWCVTKCCDDDTMTHVGYTLYFTHIRPIIPYPQVAHLCKLCSANCRFIVFLHASQKSGLCPTPTPTPRIVTLRNNGALDVFTLWILSVQNFSSCQQEHPGRSCFLALTHFSDLHPQHNTLGLASCFYSSN